MTSQSMPKFADMIVEGIKAHGHIVEVWSPAPFFYSLSIAENIKKWLGYIDQYIVFPIQVKRKIKLLPANTVFVFSDQALGPWVPLVANRLHVIHVHDFMALKSSLGELKLNPTSWSGKLYQAIIRRGFAHGKNFISVSKNTQTDLHRFLPAIPDLSEVIYNGLNFPFYPMPCDESTKLLLTLTDLKTLKSGFLLHVGGNQWYKNRIGVLEIYLEYAKHVQNPLPLWMVGAPPTDEMQSIASKIDAKGQIQFLNGLSNEQICAAYSSSALLLFPSHAEGFGWPIAEAMACGCLVLTTQEAPMTEVGGDAAFYIPPKLNSNILDWANNAAKLIESILSLSPDEKLHRVNLGLEQVKQFDTQRTLDAYNKIYQTISGFSEDPSIS